MSALQNSARGLGLAFLLLQSPLAASESTADNSSATVNWPQFRGPGALPIGTDPDLPSRWSASEHVEWSVAIPGMGWSSPIVWGDRVFVTSAVSHGKMKQPSLGVDFSNEYVAELTKEGKSIEEAIALVTDRDNELPNEVSITYKLFAFDLDSGQKVWERDLYSGPPAIGRHRKNSYASETPVTDGRAVYVYVGHQGLYAFDLDGGKLWQTPLDAHQIYLNFGSGSSPALHEGRLYVLNDNEEASYLAAFDAATGQRLWSTPRVGLGSERMRSAWSTPFVWENELRTEIVTSGPGSAISYDLEGKELWRLSPMSQNAIQSPFAAQGMLYLTSGTAGEPIKPIAALRPGASGEIDLSDTTTGGASTSALGDGSAQRWVAWLHDDAGGSYLPTPVVYQDRLYHLTDKGIFTVFDALTGKQVYRSRIHREARNFTASPWAYGGQVFVLNEEGTTFVLRAGDDFELLGMNRLDEFTQASPAIVGDRLLLRTQSKLYCIRE